MVNNRPLKGNGKTAYKPGITEVYTSFVDHLWHLWDSVFFAYLQGDKHFGHRTRPSEDDALLPCVLSAFVADVRHHDADLVA